MKVIILKIAREKLLPKLIPRH